MISLPKAVWAPIVDEVTFNRVQERPTKNHCAKKPESISRFPFILTEVNGLSFGEKLSNQSPDQYKP